MLAAQSCLGARIIPVTSAGYRMALAALGRRIYTGDTWCCPAGNTASESWPRLMLGAPFRAGATHVVQLGPVAIAYVHNQVVCDAGELGDCLSRLASKARHCGPARRSGCDRTDAFPNHLSSPVGCGHRDEITDRSCGCARAIAVPVERLLLTTAPPPIARGFAGSADSSASYPLVCLFRYWRHLSDIAGRW